MQNQHRFIIAATLLGTNSCSFGQETQKQVRLKTTGGQYIGTVSGGKLLELTSKKGEQQLFTLIDLNGDDLVDGDAVNVKYTPGLPVGGGTASPPNYWRVEDGQVRRGSQPDTFQIKKMGNAYAFLTTNGKYMAAPQGGKSSLTLAGSLEGALQVAIVQEGSPEGRVETPTTTPQTPASQLATAWLAANRSVKPQPLPVPANGTSITAFGAIGDGKTLNTEKIQKAIDQIAIKGGTLVIPKGVFLSSSIFLKPGVNLYLAEGAVLLGSPNIADYPRGRTRIEGHYEEYFVPALVNADKCNNLRITGSGTIDGNGPTYWKEFQTRYKADKKTKNLDVLRPRLTIIQNSNDVQIRGVTFKDSGYWTLHLYRCANVLIENSRFEVPKDNKIKSPSTDGIDIDSSQHVTVRGCSFRVDDDCIAMKGSKGPLAMEDKDSPPVEHIRVENCLFERGHGVMTLGSEATVVRDVVVENCLVTGKIPVVRLKLRPDTPQLYEDIHLRNLTLTGTEASFNDGAIIEIKPWTQYFDLKGQQPPTSVVKNVTLTDVKGTFGSFGEIKGNPRQTTISDITLKNIDVQLKNEKLSVGDVKNLKIENVTVNGKPYSQ